MLVLYAGLGREMTADYDQRSCILSGAGRYQLTDGKSKLLLDSCGQEEKTVGGFKKQCYRSDPKE
jgi:hypothetical protein